MGAINLESYKCVRHLSKFSTCTHCRDICPTGAIVIEHEGAPAINFNSCVACGGCAGVCPSEALRLDDFNTTEFFFDFGADADNLISCRKNVPCISVLNIEHVIGLATLKGGLRFDMGHCDSCDIAHRCKVQIERLADEADYLLEAMQSSGSVELVSVAYEEDTNKEVDRRDFLRSFNLKNAVMAKSKFEREVETATDELIEHTLDAGGISQIRQKQIPDKRKLLFTALKRAPRPDLYHVVDAKEVSFTSQKLLDPDTCTACQMCYRICPTGALTSDARNSKIDFDPFLCIKCHLCHDVCEPDSLTLSPSYNMKEFFEPAVQKMVAFNVKRCNECDGLFVSLKGEKVCHRCKLEEEEARELWGIGEDEF